MKKFCAFFLLLPHLVNKNIKLMNKNHNWTWLLSKKMLNTATLVVVLAFTSFAVKHGANNPNINTKSYLPTYVNSYDYLLKNNSSNIDLQQQDSIYSFADQMPYFGDSAETSMKNLMKYFGENINYPDIIISRGISGTIYANLIVEKDGSVSNVKIIRGLDSLLDKESNKVISNLPRWTSGKQNGETVRVAITIPIKFQIALPENLKESSNTLQEEEPIFVAVEEMPYFGKNKNRCMEDMRTFLTKNTLYPVEAASKGIQGNVFVQFVINKEGKVTDVKIMRGVHPILDAEAIRVAESMPNWTPGKQNGKTVKVAFTTVIKF